MRELEQIRNEIDSIDMQLIELLEKRIDCVIEVAEFKEKHRIPILNKAREEEVISKNSRYLKNKMYYDAMVDFLSSNMRISKELQNIYMNSERYGLLGEKLGHSISPMIHSLALKETGNRGFYRLFEVDRGCLKQWFEETKDKGLKGINVTIPYKIEIMNYLDKISDEARRIGSVNTVYFKDGEAIGYNTDYNGFGKLLSKFKIRVDEKKIVILGSGGAARSVLCCCIDNNAEEIFIVSRGGNKNKEISGAKVISYDELYSLDNKDIIINCTPCGMYPLVENTPIKEKVLSKFQTAVDLIYNPQETIFLKSAKNLGLQCVNGLYMLVAQAVAAQEIWNDIKIDDSIIDKIYMKTMEMI